MVTKFFWGFFYQQKRVWGRVVTALRSRLYFAKLTDTDGLRPPQHHHVMVQPWFSMKKYTNVLISLGR